MASVSTSQKTGVRRVLFVKADGTRTAIHVGKVAMATAFEIGAHIEHLILCQQSRDDVRRSTREWVEHIRVQWPRLARRLSELNLISQKAEGATRRHDQKTTLADFADEWIAARTDVRPNTVRLWQQTAVRIREFFGSAPVESLTAKHATDFKRWLLTSAEKGGAGYGSASAGKHMAVTKAILKEAVDAGLITANPFGSSKIERQVNNSRQRFIEASVINRVIEKCPDDEMKLVIALSRWGGLRTPSEPFSLKWKHIDLNRRRVLVQCVKTETKGKPTREIPLFPELVPFVERLRSSAGNVEPEDFVIATLRRSTGSNIRKRLSCAIRLAGIKAWPRVFHNLRSSRQTELEERFPRKTVCEWMGNSEQIADQHYLQVRDEHFRKATGASRSNLDAGH
jgi:integrase